MNNSFKKSKDYKDLVQDNSVLKEFWDNALNNIINVRKKLTSKLNNYSLGDIVIDTKNIELGIVIGDFTSGPESNKPKFRTLLLVTMDFPIGEALNKIASAKRGESISLLGGYPIDPKFRVRYTNERYVQKLEGIVSDTNNSSCDLSNFCKYQCIMPCSKECELFKFGFGKSEEN